MYRIGRSVLKNLGLKNVPLPSINNNFLRKMRVLKSRLSSNHHESAKKSGHLLEGKPVVQKYLQLSSFSNTHFMFCDIYI